MRLSFAVLAFLSILPASLRCLALNSESLDGQWQLAADHSDQGRQQMWFAPGKFPSDAQTTRVPGNVFDTITVSHWPDLKNQLAWYSLTFTPRLSVPPGNRVYLRFDGVNKKSEVWLNGTSVGSHNGAESPFEIDVTQTIHWGAANSLVVRDWSDAFAGIDNHVTLVDQPAVRIIDVFARPDAKAGRIDVDLNLENNTGQPASVDLAATCAEWKSSRAVANQKTTATVAPGLSTKRLTLPVAQPHLWNLEDPFLYTVKATLDWHSPQGARADSYACRIGFRDFRNVGGYFYLNGKRIFLRSIHTGGHFDPIRVWATPSDTAYLGKIFPELKSAGFNMVRFLQGTPLPWQLDQADEMGFMILSENEDSWHTPGPDQFGTTVNAMVRRDRNHPSLVIWELLNETENMAVYQKAKNWLPSLRAVDDTRYVELSSGRFDHDALTGSGSNPGSPTWDVYLGGEDPVKPGDTGTMPDDLGSFRTKMGDVHPYPFYPLSWGTLMAIAHLSQDAKPVFVSETGMGSSYDAVSEKAKLDVLAPPDAYAYRWVRDNAAGLEQTWKNYDLAGTYPDVPAMMHDSQLSAALQRAELFSALRGNPKLDGYSLTSTYDAGGAGEGIMDDFGVLKAGHLEMLRAGWAPLRWCLLTNPTHIYADQPLHVFASVATEDQLVPADYPVTLTIHGAAGDVWTKKASFTVKADGPLAYPVLDEDVRVPNLTEGTYQLNATLDNHANAAASSVTFHVTSRKSLPALTGATLVVAGLPAPARQFLTDRGATLHDYEGGGQGGAGVVVVGDGFKGGPEAWRALYAAAASGAHLVFLSNSVFAAPNDALHWLALPNRGTLATNPEWLYHRDYVAKPGPLWSGLPTKLMFPEYYGPMLAHVQFINDLAPAPETGALGIDCTGDLDGHSEHHDGLALGTFPFHNGFITLCGFDLLGTIGHPATDRLLVNVVKQAMAETNAQQPAPGDLPAELDKLNIK